MAENNVNAVVFIAHNLCGIDVHEVALLENVNSLKINLTIKDGYLGNL